MARPDADLRPVIDSLVINLRREVPSLMPIVASAVATTLARRLDDAGLLEEEHPCARIGCTESAEMGFLTCREHRDMD